MRVLSCVSEQYTINPILLDFVGANQMEMSNFQLKTIPIQENQYLGSETETME